MVYKRFRLHCITRVLLLGATIYLFIYLLIHTTYYATVLVVGVITCYQIYALIHYVDRTNRDLARFLESIQYSDFSQTFTAAGLGSSFDVLKSSFNRVLDDFRRARAEKEEHYRYLQTVVQHVGIGLISFQRNGDIELMNTAARRLLKITYPLSNIKSLERFNKPLVDTLFRLKPGERRSIRVQNNDEIMQLVIYATEFKLREQVLVLVSIQNIQSELEEKEMEAWQNLIRVLTHEIMNSVTPIASLASTAKDLLSDGQGSRTTTDETISDVRDAVGTIQKRSQGLIHFVDTYRKLTRIPKPEFQIIPVVELFERIGQLMQGEMDNKGIGFQMNIDPKSLELTADSELIEQVVINLLLNAIEAVQDQTDPRVELTSGMDDRGRCFIQVSDNGPGILEEVQEKIFIPFFTTKPEGSGIGLSFSRQVMRLHKGTISVQSKPNFKTVFALRF